MWRKGRSNRQSGQDGTEEDPSTLHSDEVSGNGMGCAVNNAIPDTVEKSVNNSSECSTVQYRTCTSPRRYQQKFERVASPFNDIDLLR